jgi:hypothetical protein
MLNGLPTAAAIASNATRQGHDPAPSGQSTRCRVSRAQRQRGPRRVARRLAVGLAMSPLAAPQAGGEAAQALQAEPTNARLVETEVVTDLVTHGRDHLLSQAFGIVAKVAY